MATRSSSDKCQLFQLLNLKNICHTIVDIDNHISTQYFITVHVTVENNCILRDKLLKQFNSNIKNYAVGNTIHNEQLYLLALLEFNNKYKFTEVLSQVQSLFPSPQIFYIQQVTNFSQAALYISKKDVFTLKTNISCRKLSPEFQVVFQFQQHPHITKFKEMETRLITNYKAGTPVEALFSHYQALKLDDHFVGYQPYDKTLVKWPEEVRVQYNKIVRGECLKPIFISGNEYYNADYLLKLLCKKQENFINYCYCPVSLNKDTYERKFNSLGHKFIVIKNFSRLMSNTPEDSIKFVLQRSFTHKTKYHWETGSTTFKFEGPIVIMSEEAPPKFMRNSVKWIVADVPLKKIFKKRQKSCGGLRGEKENLSQFSSPQKSTEETGRNKVNMLC